MRFLSHHDTMRVVERLAARVKLPLRYSQGFNPHPVMSLVCPRPVGIATQADRLLISLEEPIESEELCRKLNSSAPQGMTFGPAEIVERTTPPRKITYELPLPEDKISAVSHKLAELRNLSAWPLERVSRGASDNEKISGKMLDLKALITEVDIVEGVLRWTCIPLGDIWARPGEMLRLLELDDRTELASTVRTDVEYGT